MRKIKVLFFAADPVLGRRGGQALELDEELRRIRQRVKQAKHGHRLIFEPHGATRADDLMDCLENTDARVVHFSGHGGRGGLVLVGRDGRTPHPVNAAALREMFRTYQGPVRLAVLSACSSHAEAQAIADVIGCAIGTSDNISDDAAITFSSRFYQAVANGDSVQRAFDVASMALQVHRVPKSERPRVFVRKGVDPAGLVLVKTVKIAPRRVAIAAVACAATAIFTLLPPRPVLPELTASDIACGAVPPVAEAPTAESRSAASASAADPAGTDEDLAQAKAFYRARNYAQAAAAFQQAAGAGSGEAMACLGHMYLNGVGVDSQPVPGFELVHQAATEERDAHGMYALGMAYLNGLGTDRREHLARDWFEKAAEKGFPAAMRTLGDMVQVEMSDSSYREALAWYGKAVDAGCADARVNIGLMYEFGRGVARDKAAALRWYRAAAQAGSARGMSAVGQSYQNGVGVPRDFALAMAWYRKAVKAGSADAMNSIGVLYDNGHGVRKSRAKAIEWYERAAQAGSKIAKGNLAAMGRG